MRLILLLLMIACALSKQRWKKQLNKNKEEKLVLMRTVTTFDVASLLPNGGAITIPCGDLFKVYPSAGLF